MPGAMSIYSLLSLLCRFSVGIVSQNAGRSHPSSARMCASCSSLAFLSEVCVVGASGSPPSTPAETKGPSRACNPPVSARRRPPIMVVHGGRHARVRCAGGCILSRLEAGAQHPGPAQSAARVRLGARRAHLSADAHPPGTQAETSFRNRPRRPYSASAPGGSGDLHLDRADARFAISGCAS